MKSFALLRRALIALTLAGLIVSFALPASVQAEVVYALPQALQGLARKLYAGRFDRAEDREVVRSRIDQAIELSIRRLNFVARRVARSKLRDLTRPCENFQFRFSDELSTIQCEDRKPNQARLDGQPVRRTWQEDDEYELRHELAGRRITQTFRSGHGRRSDVYQLDQNGEALTVRTVIESKWLYRPVEYEIVYRRSPSARSGAEATPQGGTQPLKSPSAS